MFVCVYFGMAILLWNDFERVVITLFTGLGLIFTAMEDKITHFGLLLTSMLVTHPHAQGENKKVKMIKPSSVN